MQAGPLLVRVISVKVEPAPLPLGVATISSCSASQGPTGVLSGVDGGALWVVVVLVVEVDVSGVAAFICEVFCVPQALSPTARQKTAAAIPMVVVVRRGVVILPSLCIVMATPRVPGA